MVDVGNRVFTNVMLYVQNFYPDADFNNSVAAIPQHLPAVSVRQMDSREVALDLSLGDTDEDYAIDSNIEIQVYSAKSTDEARNIIKAACDAMRGMTYSRNFGPTEIPLPNDPNQYRWVARFHRIIGGVEEIPKYIIPTGGN